MGVFASILGFLGAGGNGLIQAAADTVKRRAERKTLAATAAAKVGLMRAGTESQVTLAREEWEAYAVRATATSWRDEAVTVVLLSPIVTLFLGALWAGVQGGTPDSLLEAGERMIASLNALEGEYAYLLSVCVLAALGIRYRRPRP